MKRILIATIPLVLFSAPAVAGGGLDSFLDNLNNQAGVAISDFAAKLSSQFGVPLPQVEAVIETVTAPPTPLCVFSLGG